MISYLAASFGVFSFSFCLPHVQVKMALRTYWSPKLQFRVLHLSWWILMIVPRTEKWDSALFSGSRFVHICLAFSSPLSMFSLKRQSHYSLNVRIESLLFSQCVLFYLLLSVLHSFFLSNNVLCFYIFSHHAFPSSYGLVLGSISLRVGGNAKTYQRSYLDINSSSITYITKWVAAN